MALPIFRPKRQTNFSQAGLLLLDHELLHLRAPASESFYLVLYSIYGIWIYGKCLCRYIYEKQSLLILKSLFLWMKKLSDPDAFSSSEWSTRLISPRHIWHPCLSVMEGKHAICLTLFPIILICINQNFKKNERKFRGLYVINPLYMQSCYKFATPHNQVGPKSSRTILVPVAWCDIVQVDLCWLTRSPPPVS